MPARTTIVAVVAAVHEAGRSRVVGTVRKDGGLVKATRQEKKREITREQLRAASDCAL